MSMYAYWLANSGLTVHKLTGLMTEGIGAEELYALQETRMKKIRVLDEKDVGKITQSRRQWDVQERWGKLQEEGIGFVCVEDARYPQKLRRISATPYALYYIGRLPEETRKSVAIVGARTRSAYGSQITGKLARALAQNRMDIISGMAKGIDGTGQRAALNAGGKSYAVLGSGVDVCYPRDHIGLYMDIIEHGGGILSEFPPGTPPLAMNFPMRNRIISGLSDAVLVMEARLRSGSLITADMALEQGKDVYALPGPLDSPLSAGCNHLIQQGAGILLNPKNLLEEWGIETNVLCRNTEIKNEKNKKVLESTDDLVYSCVGLYPKNVDQIAQESRVEIRKLMSILVTLELQGYIREITKNYYIRIK